MKVVLILILVFCASVINAEEKEQEKEDVFEDAVNEFAPELVTPLIMLYTPKSYTIPITVNKRYGKIVYGKKAYFTSAYLCHIDDEKRIQEFEEMPKRNSPFDSEKEMNLYLQNCLIDTKSKNPHQVCSMEIEPYVHKVIKNNNEPKLCGSGFGGMLYTFEYLICKPIKSLGKTILNWLPKSNRQEKVLSTKRIILYEFCYDQYHHKLLYTGFVMRSPLLLKNSQLMGKFAIYESDTINTDGYNILGDEFKLVEKNFKKTLENQISNESVLHKLVPPESMAFGHWKKSTYHYANITLMPTEVSSVWNFIDERIRQIAIKTASEFEIYMGEFTSIGDKEKFWCKIVRGRAEAVAIIVRDKEHANSDLQLYQLTDCDQMKCEFEKWPGREKVETSLARCCPVQDKHRSLFGLERPKYIKSGKSENYLDLDKISWF